MTPLLTWTLPLTHLTNLKVHFVGLWNKFPQLTLKSHNFLRFFTKEVGKPALNSRSQWIRSVRKITTRASFFVARRNFCLMWHTTEIIRPWQWGKVLLTVAHAKPRRTTNLTLHLKYQGLVNHPSFWGENFPNVWLWVTAGYSDIPLRALCGLVDTPITWPKAPKRTQEEELGTDRNAGHSVSPAELDAESPSSLFAANGERKWCVLV